MNFSKAIYTKNGDVVTLTESEAVGVMNALAQGQKWVVVQGEMYSTDTIARVGNHESSAQIKKVSEADMERKLELSGRRDLVDARRLLAKKMTVQRVLKEEDELLQLPMSAEESENGDSEYYLDQFGQKMYS